MPYPNEHACRLVEPSKFKKDTYKRITRRSGSKVYSVIVAKLKGKDTMKEQSYRYKKATWKEGEAKKHCKEHEGTFEAAISTRKFFVTIIDNLLKKLNS